MNTQIGEYKIIEKLGSGGFGTVYKASDANGNIVALKTLNSELLDNAKVLKKFFNEAMILSKLEHKNITRLYEFFPHENNYVIVMEYVDGITLKELIKQKNGKISSEQAMDIVKQVLQAFQSAHDKNIIHRDIKPSNFMIDKNKTIKVMDFGIAKMSSTASQGTSKWGTYQYSAPERFMNGSIIDKRSDIYSLGVMFYEMFTGRRLFDSDDTARIMYCHIHEFPEPLLKYSKKIPNNVNDAILRALEKDHTKRFDNCNDFSKALSPSFASLDNTATEMNLDTSTMTAIMQKEEPKEEPKEDKKRLYLSRYMLIPLALMVISGGIYFNWDNIVPKGKDKETFVPEKELIKETVVKKEQINIESTYSDKANELYNNGNYDVALEYAEKAIKYNSKDLKALIVAGNIQHKNANNQKALELFKIAEKIDNNNKDVAAGMNLSKTSLLGEYKIKSRYQFENGNYDRAMVFVSQALNIDPGNTEMQKFLNDIKSAKKTEEELGLR